MKYLRQLRCKCHSAHKLPEVAPPKIEKRDFACLISNFRNVSLHTNPLQSFIVKYNKNETCGNLLLNKNLKGKACRSYDGEVIPFLKLPPQNSCVTSKAKGPLTILGITADMFCCHCSSLEINPPLHLLCHNIFNKAYNGQEEHLPHVVETGLSFIGHN